MSPNRVKKMNEKTDLRIQRTYKLLTDALLEMLNEESFEEITVRNLCQRAMVRPATFYKHFGDKYELFTFIVKEKQRQFHTENPFKSDPKRPQTYYVGLIEQTLGFFEENKSLVRGVFDSSGSAVLVNMMSEQIEEQLCREFKADEKRRAIMPGKPELMAPLFTGALMYLSYWWVRHNWEVPKDELVRECVKILKIM